MPNKLTDNLANNFPILANELSDGEIKKAYELCFAEKGTSYTCAVCPYHQFGELCKVNRNKDALDLIDRYEKEKNKAWELFKKKCDENIELQMICDKQKAEIEKLNKIILKGDFSSITALRAREHWFRQNTEHINRLNAEIERLKNILLCFMGALGKVRNIDDIESISQIPLMTELNKGIRAEIKAEAYKECLEKAKNKIFPQLTSSTLEKKEAYYYCLDVLNNLLNELVGDADGENN